MRMIIIIVFHSVWSNNWYTIYKKRDSIWHIFYPDNIIKKVSTFVYKNLHFDVSIGYNKVLYNLFSTPSAMYESKDRTDDRFDKKFTEQKNILNNVMADENKAKQVRQYMLKRILEVSDKTDYGWSVEVKKDITHIQKLAPSDIGEDVLWEYQSDVVRGLQKDLFAELNVAEKYTIAQTFKDMKDLKIGDSIYSWDIRDDEWQSYFQKSNIDINSLSHNPQKEQDVMDKVAKFLYGKPYSIVCDLQVDPTKTKDIGPGTQLSFPWWRSWWEE